jgi:hypothetical protein
VRDDDDDITSVHEGYLPHAVHQGLGKFCIQQLRSLGAYGHCCNIWLPQGSICVDRLAGGGASLAVLLSIHERQEISGMVCTVLHMSHEVFCAKVFAQST